MSRTKSVLFFFTLSCALTGAARASTVEVKIVYPRENSKIGPVKNSFVFGSVKPASATLSINGSTVPVYRTGSFLAYIPFTSGEFQIKAEAVAGGEKAEDVRAVMIPQADAALPLTPIKIAQESLEPSLPLILRAGDVIGIKFRGSPEAKAEFRFKTPKDGVSKSDWKLMSERSYPVEGSYDGYARAPLEANGCVVEVRLTNTNGISARAQTNNPIKVVSSPFQMADTKSDETILRTGPSIGAELMGYDLFLPKGTMMEVTGRSGNELRLKVAENIEGWTEEKNLDVRDAKILPKTIIDSVKIKEKDKSTLITVETKRGIPYRAILSEDLKTFRLVLYQAISNIDRVRQDQENPSRGLIYFRWLQISADTLELEFPMKKKIWGYDVRYDAGKLTCEIFDAPTVKSDRVPLKDVMIAVDPGHSPELTDGTVGPQGIKESEVNFQTAVKLARELEKAGAKVYMTKLSTENMTLPERGKRAFENKADLFVSIHANALPDGQDPYERRGFSVFYYQPQSLDLARAVHESYNKNLKTQDDGFYYANLAVCRTTQMPAILAESGYLIRPDEEELLLDPEFQTKVAKALAEGIANFLRKWNTK